MKQKFDPCVYGALANLGWSNRKIARHMGVSEMSVRRGLAKLTQRRRYVV